MPDHDYGKITKEIAERWPEYFSKPKPGYLWVYTCLHCGKNAGDGHHFRDSKSGCLVPTILELKDKLERKDRALIQIKEAEVWTTPENLILQIRQTATEAL